MSTWPQGVKNEMFWQYEKNVDFEWYGWSGNWQVNSLIEIGQLVRACSRTARFIVHGSTARMLGMFVWFPLVAKSSHKTW